MKRIAFSLLMAAAVALVVVGYLRLGAPRAVLVAGRNDTGVTTADQARSTPATAPTANRPSPPASAAAAVPPPAATDGTDETLAALTNFNNWAARFLSGDPSASAARGEALAWQRREAMLELIATQPEQALAHAVPFAWRRALPENITRHFEQWMDGRGPLEVFVATDFERAKSRVLRETQIGDARYQVFVYGRRLRQTSATPIPLHGIALDGKLALLPDPVRLLTAEEADALDQSRGRAAEVICGVSGQPVAARGQPVAADIGGEVKRFCGVDHAELANRQMILAESGGSAQRTTAANDAWTRGPKNLLYMRVNFPDDLTEPISEAQAYDVMDSANDFYTEGSYDVTSLSPTVTPLLTLPNTKWWYSTAGPGALLNDARAAARRAGFETANYQLDIVAFTSVPGYDFGGLAAVHGKANWLQSTGGGVTTHELGHNYGLWHANFWDAITNHSRIASGTNSEYGNIYDTMGRAAAGNYHFNATFKNALGWLPDPAVHNVTSNGVYRIYSFDTPERVEGRFYAASVKKDFQRDYWLEFRQQFSNPWLQHGVLLNWSPWAESHGGTQLLDTTPGSPTGDLSREDAAVVIGRTFSDAVADLHLTPLARGVTGTNVWMDVQIHRGTARTNQWPVAQLEIDPTNAAPGALVHFHATASDADGDALAYAWTFDDLSFSTNNLPWTFRRWAASGEHVVRCVVSDMKGGVASANYVVTVGARTGQRITGRVVDLHGDPLEGVRVDNSGTNPPTVIGYTDSSGAFVLVGATGEITLNAFQYGFTFTNLTWTNPITATTDVLYADFVATQLPSVSLAVSTNFMAENSTGTNFFTLTRTGELTNELTVGLNLSGSATRAADFTLSPALANGSNGIVFPSGTQTLAFAFKTINDVNVEGPETVTLTLLDDFTPAEFPAHVIAPLAEATITIGDDDQGQPAVSVVAVNPTILENGMDAGTFRFSRSGGTQNDLTVFYSASGTATPGTDYASLLGVVIIPAGSASATVEFQPLDDKNVEADETVTVAVTPNVAYTVSGAAAQITITDDDLLTVTIFPTGTGPAEPSASGTFTVKREGDLTANLLVSYGLSGTASNGVDYVTLPGVVTIPAGAASADISVAALNDALLEGDESVILTLLTNAGYNLGLPGRATQFLRDDEKVSVSISATDSATSEPGDDTGRFRISRGTVVNGNLTVALAISGTAISGVDYVPLDNPAVIPDGASSVTLDVIVFDDLHVEPTEDVRVTILPSTNYNVGSPSQAQVTIEDDDPNSVPAVGFSFSALSWEESLSPGVAVSLSETSSVPITVDYRVIGGTATSPSDYTLAQGTLTFDPTNRAKSIPLPIVNDTLVEPNETIRIALFNPINATLDGIKIHTYTMLDDDTASVSVTATAPNASETGPTPGNFRLTRGGATNAAITVNYEVTGTASAPGDYAPLNTSVTIPAGATFVDLPVVPANDATVELAETVVVTLLTAPGAKIVSPNVATVTLTDNDPNALPVVAVTAPHPDAVEDGRNGEFLFTRAGTSGALTLSFTVTGTASPADYATLPSFVTIPDGQNSRALPVVAVDDALIEGEETVVLSLTVRDTYRVAYSSAATVLIQDNDQRVRVDAGDFLAAEPGADTGEFTFTRFGTTNTAVPVFFTVSGTASNGADYVAISNSFTIPAGRLSATLPVVPLDDLLREGPETVTLTLQANAAYALDQPASATVTIQDDEPMLTLTATVTNILEGQKPYAALRLNRTGDPKYDFTAQLAVGGTAAYGVDYPPFLTNVYFTCGVIAIDLVVAPTNELALESLETVTATLLPNPAYTILAPSNAVINILDAGTNRTPVVTLTSPTADTVFLLGPTVGIILEATVTDDNDTNAPLTLTWTNISGPSPPEFGSTNERDTTVIFTNAGVYVLRLTADDGQLPNFTELTAVVDAVELLATNLLHWTFDQSSGTNVLDTSGAGRHGVLTGTPNWQTNGGVLGGAGRFAGTNDFARQASGSNFLDGRKAFSLSLWINSAATNTPQGIFAAADSGTNATLALSTRTLASCGNATNVIEATLATTAGSVRRLSAGHVWTNGWQHLVLTWSNGLAPALYLNGQLDQPLSGFVPLSGRLTNCPQFLVGRGPADSANSWNGWLDDVRVFPRALDAGEIAALAALPPTNYGAVVNAGSNVTVQLYQPFALAGMVTDDGQPNPPGALSNAWSWISGPAPVTITNANALTNFVVFNEVGTNVFRLIGDDGQVKVFDDLEVIAVEPTLLTVFATDPDAAELGPDPGQFTLTRAGDLTANLIVWLEFSGVSSNGADFPLLTNALTFTPGADALDLVVTPFLDDRIEGDESAILTIVSNLAYTVGSSPATVTIHDSPYGQWSVERFSLEELTFPNLSSAGADFDHDGYVNFVEYAAHRDPRSAETNAPLVMTIELDPADGLKRLTFTYTRRLPPTDTEYAISVSTNLLTWATGPDYFDEISATDDGNLLTETVTARLKTPFPTAARAFVTVRLRLLTTGP